ncbi:MAG: protein GlmU [Desulfobacterales bacterium]|nr:protein GlmU [Desulfobacterales bacterium]
MENDKITSLLKKGVQMPHPGSVFIAPEVNLDRISGKGTILHPGTRLVGKEILVMPNAVIGEETPVTLDNVIVGPHCRLKGGYFKGAVFAGKNEFGSGAHVRPGTILEEESGAAHTVGLKQTILFPFVILGSLINFCDCLMAGGTSRKNHSEVGSSFIHFNYTPNQDKATPSMLGNVHQGVMLDQKPIFLGGQGGLVGPCRINFGCITAAGSIIRKDEPQTDRLLLSGGLKTASIPWHSGGYSQIGSIYNKNIEYICALFALKAWYHHIRPLFSKSPMANALLRGMQSNLNGCIQERIKRLKQFCTNLEQARQNLLDAGKESRLVKKHSQAIDGFKEAEEIFQTTRIWETPDANGENFIRAVESRIQSESDEYTCLIQGLASRERDLGSQWLGAIENQLAAPLFI